MGTLRPRPDGHELWVEPDDRPPVFAVGEAQDRLPRGEAVLDDPVDRAADQLVGPRRPEACRDGNHAIREPRLLPLPQRLEGPASNRDLAAMEEIGRASCRERVCQYV